MTVALHNGRAVSEEEVLAFESAAGCKIPPEYHSFVRSQDGAKPDLNVFPIDEDNASGVNRFIPLSQLCREKSRVPLPTACYPIAWAEGGNYVCIDCASNGIVCFWDHEDPTNLCRLADSFAAFLELLQPFTSAQVDPDSYHVDSAWIDPDLRDELG